MVSTVSTGVVAYFDIPDGDNRAARDWAYANWRSVVFTPEQIIAAAAERLSLPDRLDACGVYFLIRNGRICYVGKATYLHARIAQHKANGRPFDSVAVIAGLPRHWAVEFEAAYIDAWQPPWNFAPGEGGADWSAELTAMLAAMPRDLVCVLPEQEPLTLAQIHALADKLG